MHLNYELQLQETARVIRLHVQRVDHHLAAELKEVLYLQSLEEPPTVVLDLSEVQEMDSSGLGALLFGKRQIHARGGDLLLVGVASSVLSMIKIAQLSHVFSVFETVEEALASLGENGSNQAGG